MIKPHFEFVHIILGPTPSGKVALIQVLFESKLASADEGQKLPSCAEVLQPVFSNLFSNSKVDFALQQHQEWPGFSGTWIVCKCLDQSAVYVSSSVSNSIKAQAERMGVRIEVPLLGLMLNISDLEANLPAWARSEADRYELMLHIERKKALGSMGSKQQDKEYAPLCSAHDSALLSDSDKRGRL